MTARDDAIEAAAQALFDATSPFFGGWRALPEQVKDTYRTRAGAVLDAAHAAGLVVYRDELEQVASAVDTEVGQHPWCVSDHINPCGDPRCVPVYVVRGYTEGDTSGVVSVSEPGNQT